jgi:hypothetical protein
MDFVAKCKRVNIGGKLLTNYLKEVVSYRQWNMMDEFKIIDQVSAGEERSKILLLVVIHKCIIDNITALTLLQRLTLHCLTVFFFERSRRICATSRRISMESC